MNNAQDPWYEIYDYIKAKYIAKFGTYTEWYALLEECATNGQSGIDTIKIAIDRIGEL